MSYICYTVFSSVQSLSRVQLFAPPWTVVNQVPLSMGVSRQGYWSGLPFPSPGDLHDQGIETMSLASPALVDELLTTVPWETLVWFSSFQFSSFQSLSHVRLFATP